VSLSLVPTRDERPARMVAESETGNILAYGGLVTLLVDSPQLDGFLEQVIRLAAEVVTPAAAGGITFDREGRFVTAATSAPLAAQVDEAQYGADSGPCLDALRQGEVVATDDLATETRWPEFASFAVAHGLGSSLSLPLRVGDRTIGALNLYAHEPAAFRGPARRHAEAFAVQCGAALTVALRQSDAAVLRRQLTEAMAARSIIDQALGILMAQQRCTAEQAFDLLRQASQHRNRKLREVAAELVTKVSGNPPQPPAPFHAVSQWLEDA
jgi:GAF domain-containing protein